MSDRIPLVVVTVSGGVAEPVFVDETVDFLIVDWDNLRSGSFIGYDPAKEAQWHLDALAPYRGMVWLEDVIADLEAIVNRTEDTWRDDQPQQN